MYHALVPVDEDSDRTTAQVETLLSLPGEAGDLTATVLYVVEEIDVPADEAGPMLIDELNESLPDLRDFPDSVRNVEKRLEAAGVETQLKRVVGDPAEGVLEAARTDEVDGIVLGSRKRSPVGKAVFGSVSQTIVLNTDRTVIIAG